MAFTTLADSFVTTHDGVPSKGTWNVIVHPVADTLPTCTTPHISVPVTFGLVPQDEIMGVVPVALKCPEPSI